MFNKISLKTRAVLVGFFILLAYGMLTSIFTDSKVIVLLTDIISGLAVIGIAFLMYPLFLNTNKFLPKSYLILKYMEGILMILGGILFLFQSTRYMRDKIYENIHLIVFIISGLVFYILLYSRRLVPRFISIWGISGIIVLTASSLLKLINMEIVYLDYFLVLIITNEIFLSIWLFVRGFNTTHRDSAILSLK